MEWKIDSWKNYSLKHNPTYSDQKKLIEVIQKLNSFPPLIFAGEVRALKKKLSEVQHKKGFLLQGGDCAESFSEFNADNIRDTFRVILQMAIILTAGTNLPIIKVGRMAGQFAKPRSYPIEIQNDGHDPELQGESWSVHNNTFAPKAFAFFCKQFIKEVRPAELTYARTRLYPQTTN